MRLGGLMCVTAAPLRHPGEREHVVSNNFSILYYSTLELFASLLEMAAPLDSGLEEVSLLLANQADDTRQQGRRLSSENRAGVTHRSSGIAARSPR